MRNQDTGIKRNWLRRMWAQPYFSYSYPHDSTLSYLRICAFSVVLSLFSIPAAAQKKEMSQARDILKKGKNVEQAEKLMTDLLKNPANHNNKKIYAIWLQSVDKQYEAANERLYLKQKQDTAAFFNLARRMFTIAETLDSLDMKPDKRGRTDIEYRKENSIRLTGLRPNLFNGGTYHVRKGNYQQAFDFFEQYLDCSRQPLFSNYDFDTSDRRVAEAAYWAVYCGYRLQQPLLTLRYRNIALRDTTKAAFTLQYMAEARRWLKDDSLYLETLREGFHRYPLSSYFFPRLTDYYSAHQLNEQALEVADSALQADSTSHLFLFAKASALFNLGRYDESITLSDTLIARCDTLPSPYYTAGTAYLNKALRLDPLRQKKLLRKTYQRACHYMERYRQLAPEEKDKWGPALYRIYLNLNMGRQFDEIDRLLKQS